MSLSPTKKLFNQIETRNLWKTEILNFEEDSALEFNPIDIYTITGGCKGEIPLNDGSFISIKENVQKDKIIYLKYNQN